MGCSCSTSCCCSNDCCPEVVPVTVNENEYSLDGNNIEATITTINSNIKDLVLQVQDSDGNNVAGNYQLEIFFVDTNDVTSSETVVPPSTPGVSRLKVVTADDGSYTLRCVHATLTTWYACIDNNAGVILSPAITLGS